MEINLNTYQLDSDLSSGYSAIQRLNNRGLVQRKKGWRRSFRPSLPSPQSLSNTVKWQNLPSWILHLLVCCFAFLAKLRCWGGDLREGAENYYYFQQKGWKRRRGKIQFIPQEWVLYRKRWKTSSKEASHLRTALNSWFVSVYWSSFLSLFKRFLQSGIPVFLALQKPAPYYPL